MGSENLKALEDIKALGHQVDLAGDLADIEPLRKRLEQIARLYPGDPEVHKAAEDAKRLVLSRAARLTLASARHRPISRPPASPDPWSATIRRRADDHSARAVPPQSPRSRPQDRPPSPAHGMGSALWIGMSVGVVLSLLLIVVLVNVARKRNVSLTELAATDVAVQIATTPPGASIRVNGEAKCTSDCKLTLPPGAYQITAFLDGYEPAASGVNLVLGKPEVLNLTLEARPADGQNPFRPGPGQGGLGSTTPGRFAGRPIRVRKSRARNAHGNRDRSERGGILQFRSGSRQAAGGERNGEHEKCAGDAGIELRRTRPPGDQFGSLEAGRQRTSRRTTPVPPVST